MLYLVILLIFLSSLLFFLIIMTFLTRRKWLILNRLGKIIKTSKEPESEDELKKPFRERVVVPFLDNISRFFSSFAPTSLTKSIQKKLAAAGNPKGIKSGGFLGLQFITAFMLSSSAYFVCSIKDIPLNKASLFAGLGFLLGFLVPLLLLERKIRARKNNIQKSLPDCLDLLTVSVEAGLGLEGAMTKVVEKMKGDLAVEFKKTLNEIKVGRPRKEALKDLGKRSGVAEMMNFTSAIIQAERLGASIGKVLRVQSDFIRQKRRQRAEEQAMKAPIKILIPLIFFIFPALFVVLMGPAAIKIANILFKRF